MPKQIPLPIPSARDNKNKTKMDFLAGEYGMY
jgi:hypothetical protein